MSARQPHETEADYEARIAREEKDTSTPNLAEDRATTFAKTESETKETPLKANTPDSPIEVTRVEEAPGKPTEEDTSGS